MTKTLRWVPQTQAMLERYGWHEGRAVKKKVEKWEGILNKEGFDLFPTAREVLNEFGGIEVNQSAAGKECAREPFVFDPTLCIGERDRFEHFEEKLRQRLYPLGEAIGGLTFMAISEEGRVYYLMHDLREVGRNIDEAIEKLVQGLHASKLY